MGFPEFVFLLEKKKESMVHHCPKRATKHLRPSPALAHLLRFQYSSPLPLPWVPYSLLALPSPFSFACEEENNV